MSGFVVGRTEHLAVAVPATRVVPGLDPLEDGAGELVSALPAVLVEQLELEGAEEALGHGVVKAVPDASHGAKQARTAEAPPEGPRRVGRPVITVGDRVASRWTTSPDGHLEGVNDELGADVIGDGPAHHPATEGVEHDGQVHLALAGRMLGDVHDPETVGLGGIEDPVHQVFGGLGVEIPPGATTTAAPMDPRDVRLAHQALHPLAGAAELLAEPQLGMDPWGAIGAAAHRPDVDDRVGEIGVVEVLVGDGLGLPGIEARGRHPHDPTADRHGQVRAGPGDEGVDHFGPGLASFAK